MIKEERSLYWVSVTVVRGRRLATVCVLHVNFKPRSKFRRYEHLELPPHMQIIFSPLSTYAPRHFGNYIFNLSSLLNPSPGDIPLNDHRTPLVATSLFRGFIFSSPAATLVVMKLMSVTDQSTADRDSSM